ncbi:MAG: hypothetical protein K0S09_1413 [Sphingobacteriaceae bacterium]|nr:hypothetical protein [Sphingobacteriaceae bacterium]
MGFGKKSDPSTGRTLDLDKTYDNIIAPAVRDAGLECVRGDEIQDSGLIDKSMYALLMYADLVIADISTYNPNAIYELGIRHAVRPYSTIIIKEKQGKIPFDIDHSRIFHYDHMGDDIGATEADRCRSELRLLIANIIESSNTDSPLYEFIRDLIPPSLPEEEYIALIEKLAREEKAIFAMRQNALQFMDQKNFVEAERSWRKLSEIVENEPYFVQQQALCKYKSAEPSAGLALQDALVIINKLDPDGDTTDPETLGITGAIYKNLYRLNGDLEYLNRAIKYYQKCYIVRNDYYTGENYAHCLELKAQAVSRKDEKTYLKFEAGRTRENITSHVLQLLESSEQRADQKWMYATLSNCFLALNDPEKAEEFENQFKDSKPTKWELETFETSKQEIINSYGKKL